MKDVSCTAIWTSLPTPLASAPSRSRLVFRRDKRLFPLDRSNDSQPFPGPLRSGFVGEAFLDPGDNQRLEFWCQHRGAKIRQDPQRLRFGP